MSEVVFWDEDTQIDFMLPGRPLYIPGAEEILPALAALTTYAREHGIRILGSEDSHALTDPEISEEPDWKLTFPPHCLAGTEGQRRVPQTSPVDPLFIESTPLPRRDLEEAVRRHRGEIFFRKQTFDAFDNPNVEPVLDLIGASTVVIYGVARDICVRVAVERFLERGREDVAVVTDATRALDRPGGEALLGTWAARGVRLLTTAAVLDGALAGARAGSA
ncbi:MAG TPA: isochorismatase family cysteine hydrolase [Gemmatimonadota bacterium]|jgi:nicotinamidase/pyrazinamidase